MKFHTVASADIQNGKGQEAWALVIKAAEYAIKTVRGERRPKSFKMSQVEATMSYGLHGMTLSSSVRRWKPL